MIEAILLFVQSPLLFDVEQFAVAEDASADDPATVTQRGLRHAPLRVGPDANPWSGLPGSLAVAAFELQLEREEIEEVAQR